MLMKNTFIRLLLIVSTLNVQAQVTRTVELVTAGTLSTNISIEEQKVLTNLIVTGIVDARDFKFIRDNLGVLSSLDISATTIKAYSGNGGTSEYSDLYPDDEVPKRAFLCEHSYQDTFLYSVKLPNTAKSIGSYAFYNCTKLKKLILPDSLTKIGSNAFFYTLSLKELSLPSSLTTIETNAFYHSSISELILPNGLKEIGGTAFANCPNINAIHFPESLLSIGDNAFLECASLAEISIGKSVQSIGKTAFGLCLALQSISVNADVPLLFGQQSYIFLGLKKSNCVLNVPYGSKPVYAMADQWSEFPTIVEDSVGFYAFRNEFRLNASEGSAGVVKIISTIPWTYLCNESWLKIGRKNGSGTDSITFTAEANTSTFGRTAVIQLQSFERGNKTISVFQEAVPKIKTVKAGELASSLTADELKFVYHLVLNGTMDSRDFKTIRDSMPRLVSLDLNAVKILAYTGRLGTDYTNEADYIPANAFYNPTTLKGKTSLESVILPESVIGISSFAFSACNSLTQITIPKKYTRIGISAFSNCLGLKKVVLQNSVMTIDNDAFEFCSSLTDLDLGDSVVSIGNQSFRYCSALKSIKLPSTVKSIGHSVFYKCVLLTDVFLGDSLVSIGSNAFGYCISLVTINLPPTLTTISSNAFAYCAGLTEFSFPDNVLIASSELFLFCSKLTKVTFGKNLLSINNSAFWGCSKLTEITIPNSVTSIGKMAFLSCKSLKKIVVDWLIPIDLSNSWQVFTDIDTACVLHIPYHTKPIYSTAKEWKTIPYIIEYPFGFVLDTYERSLPVKTTSNISFNVYSNTTWTATSDQAWLTVTPSIFDGNCSVQLIAETNTLYTTRKARVTIKAPNNMPQYVDVTQEADTKYVTVSAGGLYAALSVNERQVLTKLVIKGTLDARDFRILRDSILNLKELDIRETKILAFKGNGGTDAKGYINSFAANVLPSFAFYNSTNYSRIPPIQSILLPNSIIEIGESAFFNCQYLDSLDMPDAVTTMGKMAFANCYKMKRISLSKSLMNISNSAFYYCIGLKNVILPISVTTIGNEAFARCRFSCISIPPSVESIGSTVFGAGALTKIYVYRTLPLLFSASDVFGSMNMPTCTLYVPEGTKALYQTAEQWSNFKNIEEGTGMLLSTNVLKVPSGSTHRVTLTTNESWSVSCDQPWIQCSPMHGTGNAVLTISTEINPTHLLRRGIVTLVLTDTILPSQEISVLEFGAPKVVSVNALGLYSSLKKEEIHTLTALVVYGELNARDFRMMRDSMPQLTMIDLSNASIKSYYGNEGTNGNTLYMEDVIPPNAFFKTGSTVASNNLSIFVFPPDINAIGDEAFKMLKNLTVIRIPDMVRSIGAEAFSNCTGLDSVYMGNSVNIIGPYAFSNCALSNLNLPNSLLSIGGSAFMNASKLISVTIPNSVSSIGAEAFNNCRYLNAIDIPNSMTTLENGVFRYCVSMSNVSIPNSITSIKEFAFYRCQSLKEITIPPLVKTISNKAFSYCNALKSFTIPSTVTRIETGAFEACWNLTSIYANSTVPIDLSACVNSPAFLFYTSKCILYVPTGSKSLYAAALEWKDFSNIVERELALPVEKTQLLLMYPNPVRNGFQLNGFSNEAILTLTDMQGNLVMTKTVRPKEIVSTGDLPKGMYLVRVVAAENHLFGKLLIVD